MITTVYLGMDWPTHLSECQHWVLTWLLLSTGSVFHCTIWRNRLHYLFVPRRYAWSATNNTRLTLLFRGYSIQPDKCCTKNEIHTESLYTYDWNRTCYPFFVNVWMTSGELPEAFIHVYNGEPIPKYARVPGIQYGLTQNDVIWFRAHSTVIILGFLAILVVIVVFSRTVHVTQVPGNRYGIFRIGVLYGKMTWFWKDRGTARFHWWLVGGLGMIAGFLRRYLVGKVHVMLGVCRWGCPSNVSRVWGFHGWQFRFFIFQ